MSNDKRADILLAHIQGKQAMLNAKRAGILLAHNEGKQIQMFLAGETNAEDPEFRIEPKTLCINGMEFPKPLNTLGQGDTYWVPTDFLRACCVEHLGFTGYLESGLAFATREDCEAFLAALKSVLKP